MTALAWTVAATVWAAILALAGIWVLNRVSAWHHSHGRTVAREPKELPSTATAARPWRLLPLVRRLVERERPTSHEGAFPGWSPLAAVAAVAQAPELTTAPEQMVADHEALHAIGDAIAHFDALIEAELDRFLRRMPRERMRLSASAAQTGEIDLGELEALLHADDRLVMS